MNLESFADQPGMLNFNHKIFANLFVWILFVGKSTTTRVAEAPENIDRHEVSQRLPFCIKTWHYSTAYRLQCWNTSGKTTSRIGTQTSPPSADRVPKAILSSQPPINTPLHTLPTWGIRPSSTHQWEDTSPSHQEASTSHKTNLAHQRADTISKRSYDPPASRKESTNTNG